ncbi:KdsC family phosphatase [Motiliproteus sp.]|uniref:KdsC family phosphatase n=1 Tax=Motiliproteus sp. TaxID=1898955 RepID=UPI003BACDB08
MLKLLNQPIAAIGFDFDGVFTDNRVLVDQNGVESVWCHRGDGLGISRLRQAGLPMTVISLETNPVVAARCQKLQLPHNSGIENKRQVFLDWLDDINVAVEQAIFMGNDINDLECMAVAGVSVTVADAHPEVLSRADLILSQRGGFGAVRELADLLLRNGINHG